MKAMVVVVIAVLLISMLTLFWPAGETTVTTVNPEVSKSEAATTSAEVNEQGVTMTLPSTETNDDDRVAQMKAA